VRPSEGTIWPALPGARSTLYGHGSRGTAAERAYDETANGEIVKVTKDLGKMPSRVSVISSVREPHPAAQLENARIVVVGGRGVKNPDGFNSVRD